jgi:hypothetical protein
LLLLLLLLLNVLLLLLLLTALVLDQLLRARVGDRLPRKPRGSWRLGLCLLMGHCSLTRRLVLRLALCECGRGHATRLLDLEHGRRRALRIGRRLRVVCRLRLLLLLILLILRDGVLILFGQLGGQLLAARLARRRLFATGRGDRRQRLFRALLACLFGALLFGDGARRLVALAFGALEALACLARGRV